MTDLLRSAKRACRALASRKRVPHFLRTALHPESSLERETRRLRRVLRGVPRRTPGIVEFLEWEIEYVDAASLVSSADVLVAKGWNNFRTGTSSPRILDCGANIGISVLNFKRQYPNASIVAFEPDPRIAAVLRRNLQRNAAADVDVVEAAVWRENSRARFSCDGADGGRLGSLPPTFEREIIIDTVDLSGFISGTVDLIKLDVEGAEFDVVDSIADSLDHVRNLVIECHVRASTMGELGRMLSMIESAGFLIAVNSYGAWRDLVRRASDEGPGFDQYFLVCAWRDE